MNWVWLFLCNRSSEKVFGSNSGWLFTDAAESLFVVSITCITVFAMHCSFWFSPTLELLPMKLHDDAAGLD